MRRLRIESSRSYSGEICAPSGVMTMETNQLWWCWPQTTWREAVLPHLKRTNRQQLHRPTRRAMPQCTA